LPWCENGLPSNALNRDFNVLLEHLAFGILVEERRAEGFDLAGVVAAPDAEDDPPAGQDVGHRVILGQPQWMPTSARCGSRSRFRSS